MSALTYRQGGIDDLETLHQLAIRSYSEFKDVLEPHHWKDFDSRVRDKERFEELVNGSTSFVCNDGDKAVGAAYLVPSGKPIYVFQADWAHIRKVGVDPSYRGQGISRKLTEQCIAHARNSGEHTLALHTSEFMDAARHVYEKLGFVRVRELDLLFGKRYWLYLLDLKL